MKRLILFVLVLTMIVAPALAAEIDLSKMTDAELVELRAQIDEILNDDSGTICEGKYIVGTDIKSGHYKLTCYKFSLETLTAMAVNVFKTDNPSDWFGRYHLNAGSSVYVNLTDGMVLSLENGSCLIQTASADWAP